MDCPNCDKDKHARHLLLPLVRRLHPGAGARNEGGRLPAPPRARIDPLIGDALFFRGVGVLASINKDLEIAAAIILPFVYFVWYVALFRKGQTPGKKMLSVRVVK